MFDTPHGDAPGDLHGADGGGRQHGERVGEAAVHEQRHDMIDEDAVVEGDCRKRDGDQPECALAHGLGDGMPGAARRFGPVGAMAVFAFEPGCAEIQQRCGGEGAHAGEADGDDAPAERPGEDGAEWKGEGGGETGDERDAHDRRPGIALKRAGDEGETGFVERAGLGDADHEPGEDELHMALRVGEEEQAGAAQ